MQFDSSVPSYRKARSVKRKKLGELLYRDKSNCRTGPCRTVELVGNAEGLRAHVHAIGVSTHYPRLAKS
jgi:hypothetical protein